MDLQAIRRHLSRSFPGTQELEANGDSFFIHDPERDLPPERQIPWATIVTSDAYDRFSDLDRPGIFRLNAGLSKECFHELFPVAADHDPTALDVLMPHPVYGGQYWACVLNPETTWPRTQELLLHAHALAVRKYDNAARRRQTRQQPST